MRYKVHLLPCISGVYDIYSRTSALTFNKNAIEGVTRSVFTNCSIAYLNLSRLAITYGEKKSISMGRKKKSISMGRIVTYSIHG